MSKHTDAFYTCITERLISAMDAGVLPWRKPWRGGRALLPLRACGTAYRGINTLALWFRFWIAFRNRADPIANGVAELRRRIATNQD